MFSRFGWAGGSGHETDANRARRVAGPYPGGAHGRRVLSRTIAGLAVLGPRVAFLDHARRRRCG